MHVKIGDIYASCYIFLCGIGYFFFIAYSVLYFLLSFSLVANINFFSQFSQEER